MEKIFRIASNKRLQKQLGKPATAKVVWRYITMNHDNFIVGAVYSGGVYLTESLCLPMEDITDIGFCQILLRKAFGIPKNRKERGYGPYEKKNIYGRVVPRVTNPRQWVWDPQTKELKFQVRPSRLMTEFRRR